MEHHSNPVLCLFKDKVFQSHGRKQYIPDGSNEKTVLMRLLTKLWFWIREQTRDGENAPKPATAINHYHPWAKGQKQHYQSPVGAGACGPAAAVVMKGPNHCQRHGMEAGRKWRKKQLDLISPLPSKFLPVPPISQT